MSVERAERRRPQPVEHRADDLNRSNTAEREPRCAPAQHRFFSSLLEPPYVDITYQTRCNTLTGGTISGCMEPSVRSIFGFSGDTGLLLSCSITEQAGTRTVDLSTSAVDASAGHVALGMTLSATVAAAGGAPSGPCQFTWTDGNTFGGACGAATPSATQPCQVSAIAFTTDTMTGLPLLDIAVHCIEAPIIPATTPPTVRSLSAAGMSPADRTRDLTIHIYSCPMH